MTKAIGFCLDRLRKVSQGKPRVVRTVANSPAMSDQAFVLSEFLVIQTTVRTATNLLSFKLCGVKF